MTDLKYLCLGLAALVGACAPGGTSEPAADVPSLDEQLTALSDAAPVEDAALEGLTPAQQLLVVSDTATQAKAGILVTLDSSIDLMRLNGDNETADTLDRTRGLLIEAADENMAEFYDLAGAVYESRFSEAELRRLVELYRDPVMQKFVSQQTDMMADMVLKMDAWAETVGQDYAAKVEAAE